MVVALSVLMALASAALSRGLVLAFSASVPASNSDMVEPSICVHCLPVLASYAWASCAPESPVSAEAYGKLLCQKHPAPRFCASGPSASTCEGTRPVLAICAILTMRV